MISFCLTAVECTLSGAYRSIQTGAFSELGVNLGDLLSWELRVGYKFSEPESWKEKTFKKFCFSKFEIKSRAGVWEFWTDESRRELESDV